MRFIQLIVLCFLAVQTSKAHAQSLSVTRTIAADTRISASDVQIQDNFVAGSATDLAQVIGMEARVALYPGRAIQLSDVGPPAIIERNGYVTLIYSTGGLQISAEGRALDRAGVGERVKVMNLASRNIVFGQVDSNGRILVRP